MKNTRKIISVLLSILMIITSVPLMAVESFAADVVNSGTTGDCTWTLDSDGVLTISGNGKMGDYNWEEALPWGTKITNVVIENGVTSIGNSAFDGCTSLTNITIPDGVTSIGTYAFYGCTSLASILIPDSVTSIGAVIFEGCNSIKTATINSTAAVSAFSGNTSIENIIIGDSITSIGDRAFEKCNSLESVTIGSGITSIDDRAFEGCVSLKRIDVEEGNEYYCSIDGVLFNKDKTKLIKYPLGKKDGSYVIPNSVTEIGWSAFEDCTSLASIVIPDSVTSIGFEAFRDCTSLTSITIPDSVTKIGYYAFENTAYYNNESNWNNGILYIGNHLIKAKDDVSGSVEIKQGTKAIAESAFNGCTSLTSLTIPDSVTGVGRGVFGSGSSIKTATINSTAALYAFNGNESLESVIIGNGVTSISDWAFRECTSLASVTIPDSVTSIGESAFKGCTSLTSITIPDSVKTIGDSAFEGCNSLASVTIGNGVTSIGSSAFEGCPSLTSVTIPDSVTSIGDYAFRNCTSLTSITIPDGVTKIGRWAFYGCTLLESVSIGKGASNMYLDAFENCKSLKYVTINTERVCSVFKGCTSIESVILGNSVTEIGWSAFEGCTSLTSITIPDSVTEIGANAFKGCTSLANITIPDSVTNIRHSAFDNTAYYNNESNWDNGVLYIGDFLVAIKSDVKSISVKEGTKLIVCGNTFNDENIGFESLESITIPNSVLYIGEKAFFNCKKLKSVTIPESVINIGENAFGQYYRPTSSHSGVYEIVPDFTIYGFFGTEAERYAKKRNINFEDLRDPEALTISKAPAKTTYFIGDTLDTTGLELTLSYNNGTTEKVINGYTVSGFNSSTAGTKVVTVEYKGKTATFTVEVVKPSITIANNSLSFDSIGSTKSITVTTTPSDQKIAWSSSNENVATVSDGVVTAKGAGNATITAKFTYNNIEYTATCNVTVAVPTVPTVTFPDVASGDWYYNAVKFNAEKGYVTGYSNGTFGPSNNIQRQDFVLILARIAGADLSAYEGQNGGFSDVQAGAYYASAVAWAKDKGIVTGYSADNFGVGTYISREQISLILCRYLGGEASGDVDTILNAYSDGGNTSPWAKAGVAWAVENGIIGNSDYLNPNGNAGRAEVAQIIYNMSNKGML